MTELHTYVLSVDTGFAPHVRNNLISLATCKPRIRKKAEIGDWVIGTGSAESEHVSQAQILYAMKVTEVVSTTDYFEQFPERRPIGSTTHGDNMYVPRGHVDVNKSLSGSEVSEDLKPENEVEYEVGTFEGQPCYAEKGHHFFQLEAGQHNLDLFSRDIGNESRQRVLLSNDFYYFGDSNVEMPEDVAEPVVKQYGSSDGRQGHESVDGDGLDNFIEWIRGSYETGVHGTPTMRDTEDYASVTERECQ